MQVEEKCFGREEENQTKMVLSHRDCQSSAGSGLTGGVKNTDSYITRENSDRLEENLMQRHESRSVRWPHEMSCGLHAEIQAIEGRRGVYNRATRSVGAPLPFNSPL